MHWKGPFTIVSKQGVCDYIVQMGSKAKVFHVNMLKQYFERFKSHRNDNEVTSSTCVISEQDSDSFDLSVSLVLPSTVGSETYKDVVINPYLSDSQKSSVLSILSDFQQVFTDIPGRTNLVTHSIKLTSTEPINVKPYPLPYSTEQAIKVEVESMLKMGVIEPSNSPYCSPVILVSKKDGSNRFVIDFRAINQHTVFDSEPIPNPEDLFNKLGKFVFFTKFDLSKGYWQIPLENSSRPYTAFQVPQGLFQFCVLAFGLSTACATFARMMRLLLKGLNFTVNFFDDALVFSLTWEEHLSHLKLFLQRLRDQNITARPSKVSVGFTFIEFLGHTVGDGCIQPTQSKVKKILNMSVPSTKKEVRSLIGLCSYYRRFVPNFSTVMAPLTDLTKKNSATKVIWTTECQKAFDKLQTILSSRPVLILPNFHSEFILWTDASNKGLVLFYYKITKVFIIQSVTLVANY